MIPVKINFKGKDYELEHPESLNEFTPGQYLDYVRLFLLPEKAIRERWDDQLSLMLSFLSIKEFKSVTSNRYKMFNSIVKEGMAEHLVSLQEPLFEKQIFNNWILKELEHHGKNYYGVDDGFGYMTFGEFIYTDMIFMDYFDNPTNEVLTNFVATLYKWTKDEEFSTKNVEIREQELKDLPGPNQQAILFNYSMMRQWIQDEYPVIFGENKENSQEIILGNHSDGWMSIRRNLAGDVLNLDKIDKVSLHDALADLNEKMKKQ